MSRSDTRVALITGATGGLGEGLAIALARDGWTLLVHGRDSERIAALAERLIAEGAPDARPYLADFSSLAQVHAMASRILAAESRLDLLINNAGIGMRRKQALSEDGYDLVMQVNYLAAHCLSRELQPLLADGGTGAIVNIASAAQWRLDLDDFNMSRRWSPPVAYGRSKLAMIVWTLGAARELREQGIAINAIHPATLMPTRMTAELQAASRGFLGRFLKPRSTIEEGVANVLNVVEAARTRQVFGQYFNGAREARPHKQARDGSTWDRLQTISRSLYRHALPQK